LSVLAREPARTDNSVWEIGLWKSQGVLRMFAVEILYANVNESLLENGHIKLGFQYATTLKAYPSNPVVHVIFFK
jgi:hypothetical protein